MSQYESIVEWGSCFMIVDSDQHDLRAAKPLLANCLFLGNGGRLCTPVPLKQNIVLAWTQATTTTIGSLPQPGLQPHAGSNRAVGVNAFIGSHEYRAYRCLQPTAVHKKNNAPKKMHLAKTWTIYSVASLVKKSVRPLGSQLLNIWAEQCWSSPEWTFASWSTR
jgi:hypothetical protein